MSKLKIYNTLIDGENPLSNFIPELTITSSSSKHDKRTVDAILYLVTNLGNSFFRHQEFEECLNLSRETLYELFGEYYYRNTIKSDDDHVFNKLFRRWHRGNSIDGLGNSAYGTTDYFDKAYLQWLIANENQSLSLIDTDIEIDDTDDADMFSHVFVDIDAIKHRMSGNYLQLREWLSQIIQCEYLDAMNDDEVYDVAKIIQENESIRKEIVYEISALKHILAQTTDGNRLKIKYKTSDAGRYYGFGKFNLQSIKKDIRKVVLNNYHSYDIESAAPVILAQIYTRITGKPTPKSIQYYIDNKKAFRVALALYLVRSMDKAKMIFNMLFFGARTNENDIFHKTSISKLIGDKLNHALLNNRYFKPLVRDIKMMFKTIGDYYKNNHSVEVGKKWIIQNDKGREIELDKWDNGKVVAHVYQGIESIILDTCIDYYKSKHDDASYLLIHDGFYALHELNVADLEQCIFNETGFRIDYTERHETLTESQVLKTFGVYDVAISIYERFTKKKWHPKAIKSQQII
ncbi:MAG: hypothetical protein Q8R58_12675 [Sulfuricurvum sp.]|nr:hypothetical protein [Sulfuricurvum sp.]